MILLEEDPDGIFHGQGTGRHLGRDLLWEHGDSSSQAKDQS
jgi:hypothetical protein